MFITKAKDFAVVPTIHSHCVFFEVYEVVGEDTDGSLLYGSNFDSADDVDDLKDCHISGVVKWDQCSDWDFQPNNVMIHFCEAEDVDRLANMVKECIEYTKENLETWID